MENSQLLEHIGETKTKKLTDDIQKEYRELITKTFPEKENLIKTNSLIQVTDIDETEIKSIGMSCVNDLFINGWLVFISRVLGAQGGFTNLMRNSGNGQVNTYFTNSAFGMLLNTNGGSTGSRIALGSGTNPPVMDNFNVQTRLIGSPQSGDAVCGESVYSVGLSKITIPAVIAPTSDSGTIRESCLFGRWGKASPISIQTYPVSRDLISPSVNYVSAQSISIEYAILI